MEYFAGFFDAEGCISLNKNGSFPISIEVANEELPNLFKTKFGGSIYSRQRKNRKKTWIWKINSISSEAIFFINSILPFSIVKEKQLFLMQTYLNKTREGKKQSREGISSSIRAYKNPYSPNAQFFEEIKRTPTESFYKWLAGIIDGDGNFVCNQYIDNRNGKKYFGHQISFATIYPQLIQHVIHRIPGCITEMKHTGNLLYKWTCKRSSETSLCQSIIPFLKIKKQQCSLLLQFLQDIPREKRFEIIDKIKHLNSL